MIIDDLKRRARDKPDELALAFHKTSDAQPATLTWSQLWERTAQLATALLRICSVTDRVLLVFPQGLEFHLCQLACNYAGLIPVPVPLPSGSGDKERLVGILNDSDCAGILALNETLPALREIALNVPVTGYESLLAFPDDSMAQPHPSSDEDVAFIQYTSGSVGTPKGVIVTHGNLNANVRMMIEGRAADIRIVASWVPHFHDMGLIGCFYLAMHAGAELHLASANSFVRRPISWLRLISKTKATFSAVPHFAIALCARLADTVKPGELDLSSMRCLVNSSEPVDWEGVEAFEDAYAAHGLAAGTVIPHYGLAECTVMVSHPTSDSSRYLDVDREALAKGMIARCDDESRSQRIANNGRGMLDCEIAIVDPETRMRCAADRIGEIWVTGAHVAKGYWDGPAATAEVFDQTIEGDGSGKTYVRTGDLGFLHDGNLFITGRMKDVIIVRGQNYFARDIEILAEDVSPLVRESRVVAIPFRGRDGEAVGLLAEVAPKFNYRTDALEIVSGFSKRLGQRLGLMAQALVLVKKNALPRTTSGKIRRSDAGELYRSRELATVFEYEAANFSAPELCRGGFPGVEDRGLLHDWLTQLVLARAGVDDFSDEEDLFTLGVDSLSMTNFLLEIEELTEQSLLVEEFYSQPTISTLLNILMATEQTAPLAEPAERAPVKVRQTLRGKTFRQRLGFRIRDMGPSIGSLKLHYGIGTRILDRVLASQSVVKRLSRPYNNHLEQFIAEQDLEYPDALRRDYAKAFIWSGWRELCLMDPHNFEQYVTVKGAERIAQARARGQGVILSIVHSTAKGLYKLVPEIREAPFVVVGNLRADRAAFLGLGDLAYASGATAGKTVPGTRVAQIHKAHSVLREGGTTLILMDYFDGIGGIKAPILGRKRTIRPGIAELALETNSIVIPAEHWLHENGRVTIEFKEPFVEQGETREERCLSLMIQQAAALEDMWRTNPAQMDVEAFSFHMASYDT
ncbi:MAG: AMP-binding protein [Pseudomonadota bacterium]